MNPMYAAITILTTVLLIPVSDSGLHASARLAPAPGVQECSPLTTSEPDRALFRGTDGGLRSIVGFARGGARGAMYTDHAWGWRALLRPAADGRLTLDGDGAPILTFECEGGRLATLRGEGPDGVFVADRIEIDMRPVTFDGEGTHLSGWLYTPEEPVGTGVVYVHGSGPSTHYDFAEWALYLAGHGIVSLSYDKRGVGGSSGDWEEATFDDLAGDAAGALRHLREHSEVVIAGLAGTSQGAWVAPMAAAAGGADFVVVSGGGPITPARQEFYRRILLLERDGTAPDEIDRAREALDLYFRFLREPDALANEMSDVWERIAEMPWRRTVGIPPRNPTVGEWPVVRQRFARELHFDPMPHYRDLSVPVLGMLGLEDQAFPVAETILAFNELPSDMRVTVLGIPKADHGWFVDAGDGRRYVAPEAMKALTDWILAVDAPVSR